MNFAHPKVLLRVAVLICVLFGTRMSNVASAQDSFEPKYVLSTGGVSESLISTNATVEALAITDPALEFSFGFTTDESSGAGAFHDSFSVSVERRDAPGVLAFYFVVDASGLVIAPPTPDAVLLNPASIFVLPQIFPSGVAQLGQSSAYHVWAPLPEPLANHPLNIYFDLFSNSDGIDSLGWASAVTVVPEPRIGALVLAGLAVGAILWCRNRK